MNVLTYTDIANMALDWCGGAMSLQSIDDTNNPDAVLCKRNLGIAIKSELDKYEWSFGRKKLSVPIVTDETKQIQGYVCYALPSDFSRLSMYTFFQEFKTPVNDYKQPGYMIFDGYLYTVTPIQYLYYNSNDVRPVKWHSLFCDVVALNLAQRIAPKIKGTDADVAFLEQIYRAKLKDARRLELIGADATKPGMSILQYDASFGEGCYGG